MTKITDYFQSPFQGQAAEEPPAEAVTGLSPRSHFITGRMPFKVPLDDLLLLRPSEPGKVVMMGREIPTPRYVAHYMRAYRYTGMTHPAEPLPDVLQPLLDWANTRAESWGAPSGKAFNQALVNFYMDGAHYIGHHSDDEAQLLPGGVIFSASFGQERTFRIRRKAGGTHAAGDFETCAGASSLDISCADGSYIVMAGDMQKEFTHEVPRVHGRKAAGMGPRVNVTFRMFT